MIEKSYKPNVIFFIVDSTRHYYTGGMDDRDKLDMMDRFEKESIYFPVTVIPESRRFHY